MCVWLTEFQVTWGNLQPCHLQLVPPCMLKPSNFASSPLVNVMLMIIAQTFMRIQQVTNPIQGIFIMISHDRDLMSSFFIYIEGFMLSCESDYSIHTELSLWVCTYCSPRISLVFSVVCTTCLMLHIQSGCILIEEAALPIKVSGVLLKFLQ